MRGRVAPTPNLPPEMHTGTPALAALVPLAGLAIVAMLGSGKFSTDVLVGCATESAA